MEEQNKKSDRIISLNEHLNNKVDDLKIQNNDLTDKVDNLTDISEQQTKVLNNVVDRISSSNSPKAIECMLYEPIDSPIIDKDNKNTFNRILRTSRCQYNSMNTEQRNIYKNGRYIAHRSVSEGISLNKVISDKVLITI